MKQFVRQIMTKSPLIHPILTIFMKCKWQKDLVEWERVGKPVPPPTIVKQKVLRDYSKIYGLKILIETGTYLGDMIEAMRTDFDQIYSIELSKDLYDRAMRRFSGVKNVKLIYGDSGTELRNVLKKIDAPALFWLDGHYSAGITAKGDKDTPIYEELNCIFNSPDRGHVIIIDDARCFGTAPDFPSIDELNRFIRSKRPQVNIVIEDDIIRIVLKK